MENFPNPEHKEGEVAKASEHQTSKISSYVFFGLRSIQWLFHLR